MFFINICIVKTKFQEIKMLSQKIFHPIMYRVRLDRPVGHLVGCKKVFSSILVLSNCFAKLCFVFGPRDRLLDVEKYLDFLVWLSRYNNQFQQNSGVGSPDKVEKIFKGIVGLILSPSPSVQIKSMGGKVCWALSTNF